MKKTFTLQDFRYRLPEELIASKPAASRDGSRLLVLNRREKSISHENFANITDNFMPGDLLVFNNARVLNARLFFQKTTGARFEVVLSRRIDAKRWLAIVRRAKRLRPGEKLFCTLRPDISIETAARRGEEFEIITSTEFTEELLREIGRIPLPPYIKREADDDDLERYQTLFSSMPGAVAAPTAGLHFTEAVLNKINAAGVKSCFLTLYVGQGTFSPVRFDDLSLHQMHTEGYFLPEAAAALINETRKQGKRVIAVGTTSLRVLETTYKDGINTWGRGESSLFIYPPYEIKSVDALITNFHTSESTLLMLVAAFAGYDYIMRAYGEAVKERYRFFSYGDCMLIE